MIRRQLILAAALCAIGAPAIAATGNDDPAPAPLGPRTIVPIQTDEPEGKPRVSYGNPLWGIPLASLAHTRERPLFTPSRRPPAQVVIAAPPPAAAPAQPAKTPEQERLQLALIGTVISSAEGIGIFIDGPTQQMIRLRTGEEHGGWVLRSVRPREVTLEKGARTEILSLPRPGTVAAPRKPNDL